MSSEIYKQFEEIHKRMNQLEKDGKAKSKEYYDLGLEYKKIEKLLIEKNKEV